MNLLFDKKVKSFKPLINRFDYKNNQQKRTLLAQLSSIKLALNKSLFTYFEVLLFLCAYPDDDKLLLLAENELMRITKFLKNCKKIKKRFLLNSGLPYTKYMSGFTHDFVQWLLIHPECKTEINNFKNASFDLNEVLKLTLPSLERSETTAGHSNDDLFESLLIKKQNRLPFLIRELSKLDDSPYIKDHLYDGLGVYVNIYPKSKTFSRAYNRFQVQSTFYHTDLIKHFDHVSLLNSKLPDTSSLTITQRKQAILTVKNSMALTDRETDTVTYMDENSFRLYELERGISIAIYGMLPQRQLPLESYVGYTLFKNGFPAAYGGGWVFGDCSNFGINIFESFRGGESGYILCQLLRLYKQVFNISYFEIEPYQFGLDNPEGIESGAFWFYYRYGFRPLDKNLLKVSNDEQKKIVATKNYRTSKKTLEKFTLSNMALMLGKNIPVKVPEISARVTQMIEENYKGNRLKAKQDCIEKFKIKSEIKTSLNKYERQVMEEVALWANAYNIDKKEKIFLLKEMIKTKPINLYKFQQLLLQFFK